VRERLSCPVHSITRHDEGVTVWSPRGNERFDHAVLACHSDQALALLADPSERERAILGAIPYQANEVVLHTDRRLLPRHPKAWAAWNAFVPSDPDAPCTVSYCMNLLQGIASPEPFVVTLNRSEAIDPSKVLRTLRYHHPVHTQAAVAAQRRKAEIQGVRRTWYAGAYWGWGFHEDGMRSAVQLAAAFGIGWGDRSPAAGLRAAVGDVA
jgi:predicted NAD/FAD-binding protein